jgi:hypothetical protein
VRTTGCCDFKLSVDWRNGGTHDRAALASHSPGRVCAQVHAYGMEQRLAAFPTTEEQDARLLARTGPSALNPISRQIVTFRMLRKRALAAAIEALKERAAQAGSGAGGGWGGYGAPSDSHMSSGGECAEMSGDASSDEKLEL